MIYEFEGRITSEMVDSLVMPSKDMEGHNICEVVSYEEIKESPNEYLRYAYAYPEIFTEEVLIKIENDWTKENIDNFLLNLNEEEMNYLKNKL